MPFFDIIQYEGPNDVLVWKHPREDFNTASKLMVHEAQEALLFKNGSFAQLYTPNAEGYIIETKNLPFLTRMSTLLTGGQMPNHYEIYFINKARVMTLYWGTTEPMKVFDPLWNLPFDITARGQLTIQVADSEKLLKKRVGTTTAYYQEDFQKDFRGLLMPYIRSTIASLMVNEETSFFVLDPLLPTLSQKLKDVVNPITQENGIETTSFAIEAISVVEDEAYRKMKDYLVERGGQKILGYSWKELKAVGIAEKQAENPGISGTMQGVGLGVGAGIAGGQMIGSLMKNTVNVPMLQNNVQQVQPDDEYGRPKPKPKPLSMDSKSKYFCTNCGAELQQAHKFCYNCGTPKI